MNYPEKLATQGTQDEDKGTQDEDKGTQDEDKQKTKKSTQYVSLSLHVTGFSFSFLI